jgi:peptide/nickel transport system substrate-binding protein
MITVVTTCTEQQAIATPIQARLNRRQFLWLTGGAMLLSACTPFVAPAPVAPAAEPSTGETVGEPQSGGTLRLAFGGQVTNLDPHRGFTLPDFTVAQALYEALTWVDAGDPAYPVHPRLAEAWESSEDGAVWTFTLRQGVQFTNGALLTAGDVVHTFLNRALNPDVGFAFASSVGYIENVEAVDEQTVRLTLRSPVASFLRDLANVVIVPQNVTDEEFAQGSVGAGPFMLGEYLPGERISLVRNENYWDAPLPYLDEVQILTLPDDTAQVAALTGGTVEALWQVGLTSLPVLESDPNVKLLENPLGDYDVVVMKVNAAPFDDVRVRQALKLAVNREALVNVVLQGYGQPANDQPIPPSSPFWGDVAFPAYDPEQAKALLAEAGYPDGLALTLVTAPLRSSWDATAVALQEMMKPAGINITIERVPAAGYWGGPFAEANFAMSWSVSYVDPGFFLNADYRSDGVYNLTGWQSEALDALIDEGAVTQDSAARQAIYTQVQQMISMEGAVLIPYFRADIKAVHSMVHGMAADVIPSFHQVWLMRE